MKKLTIALVGLAVALFAAPAVLAESVEIVSSKDNTLYEYADGAFSNGAGTRMFAGATAQGEIRRGLVAFDIAGNVPAGATIDGVTLTLEQVMTIAQDEEVSLHRAEQDWGEGDSLALGGQGIGGISTLGDATWIHTFYDTDFWSAPGGDFAATASATQTVGGNGSYDWTSADLVADVQGWLDDPGSNFGWVIVGNEAVIVTAKTFSTREESSTPPTLTVEFTPGSDGVPAVSTWGAAALAVMLLTLATFALRRRLAAVRKD